MKKTLSAFLALVIVINILTGCGIRLSTGNTDHEPIRLGGLKGATSIGMVKLLDDAENGKTENSYEFSMDGSADELTPKFLKGELDVVAIPINLGAVLYNKTNGSVQMMAINTLGVLYIVEKGGETIRSLQDLKGRTIYATGKGSTPEYALRHLLEENGLIMDTDVTVEWKSEPTEIISAMASEENVIAMLPQPYVTVASSQVEGLRVALDLTEEWENLGDDGMFITAGLFVRTEFAKNHAASLQKLLEEYEDSTQYANDHIEETSMLVEKYGIVKAAVAKQAIPQCNIVCITGNEMKKDSEGYLQVLYEQNQDSVGGSLPEKDFYLIYE